MSRSAEVRPLVVAAAYVAAMAVFIYAVLDPSLGYGSDAAAWIGIGALVALHLLTGWEIGRWWALLLPLLAIPLAVPAGYSARTEPQIWVGMAHVGAPLGILTMAVAVAARRVGLRRRA